MRRLRDNDEEYILMSPKSMVQESCMLKLNEREDGTFTVTSIAYKSVHEDDWEHTHIKSEVVFETLEQLYAAVQATYKLTFMTKQEAFVEII